MVVPLQLGCLLLWRQPRWPVHHKGRQRRHPGELKHPVVDRVQQCRKPTVLAPFLGVRFRRPAGRQREQGTLASKHAFLVDSSLSVGHPHGKHPVHPALQDGGQTKPPQRELEHQQVAPAQLVHLRLHLRRKPAVFGRVEFLLLLLEVGRIAHRGEVAPVGDRVPAHRVQVRDNDLVPQRP